LPNTHIDFRDGGCQILSAVSYLRLVKPRFGFLNGCRSSCAIDRDDVGVHSGLNEAAFPFAVHTDTSRDSHFSIQYIRRLLGYY
jgi:hypothetical protein